MSLLNKNPANLYRDIKARIPSIKIKNKEFMNKHHGLDMSSDFWWAVSGEYAIEAEYLIMNSSEDPRFLNDLKKSHIEFPPENMINKTFIRSFGKDSIIGKNSFVNTDNVSKSVDELLIDVEEEEEKFSSDIRTSPLKEYLPMKYFTIFLTQLRLRKFKHLYLKIKKKIKLIYNNSNIDNELDEIFYSINPNEDYAKILHFILPEYLNRFFPKWFLWLSNYIVNPKHKWVTRFGYERNIYDIILMAKSYQKYGTKNIQIIAHGTLGVSLWYLYRISLFPNMKLYNVNEGTVLPKKPTPKLSSGILFCPPQFPTPLNFFSIQHYQEFMKVYKKVIQLINDGLKDGRKIKIRYKNFKYMSGFAGPHTPEECQIPIEKEKFEDVYQKYKLIVSMPFGTISEKCYINNINCITYNYPYGIMNKQLYLKTNTYPGVFKDANMFLKELEKKIRECRKK